MDINESELYEAVGGMPAFEALVEAFYRGVEQDPPLRALYPPDLTAGKQHLTWFIAQRFGGPPTFDERRGPPRLRMRHMGFPIDTAMSEAWLKHMKAALKEVKVFDPYRTMLEAYFLDAARWLVNRA